MQLATGWATLLDVARLSGPDGAPAKVAEVLTQWNEILDDIPWVEGNLPTGHKSVLRANLPVPTYRLLNQGVVPVKSTGNQIVDDVAQMVAYAEVDKTLVNLSSNPQAFRFGQDKAIIQGMGQSLASTLIYGDSSTTPEKFNGLASRYYSVAGSATSGQIIDALGTGTDNTSIWLVGWNEESIFGIYPKGSTGGLQQKDLGQVTLLDANGGRYEGYRSYYEWNCGISVPDYRFVVRICNIDVSDLRTAGDGTDTSSNLFKYMSMALDLLPPVGNFRPVFYMNNTVKSMLRVKLISKSNLWLSLDDMKGASGIMRPTLAFQGVPCRRIDAITNTEARIV